MGGNRFVGKLVSQKLHAQHCEITLLNRSGTSPIECKIIQCDRNDEKALFNALLGKKFDCVIDMCLYNLEQAKKSLKIIEKITEKYIFISSVAVYAGEQPRPITECSDCGQWTLFGSYGTDKYAAEEYIKETKEVSYTILRPSYVIGSGNPHDRERLYFKNIISGKPVQLEGDGQATLSFVFAEDLANIIVDFTQNTKVKNQTYNACGDEHITLKQFVNMISSIIEKPAKYESTGGPFSFKNQDCFFSNEKIKTDINYKFKELYDGLAEIYEEEYKIP